MTVGGDGGQAGASPSSHAASARPRGRCRPIALTGIAAAATRVGGPGRGRPAWRGGRWMGNSGGVALWWRVGVRWERRPPRWTWTGRKCDRKRRHRPPPFTIPEHPQSKHGPHGRALQTPQRAPTTRAEALCPTTCGQSGGRGRSRVDHGRGRGGVSSHTPHPRHPRRRVLPPAPPPLPHPSPHKQLPLQSPTSPPPPVPDTPRPHGNRLVHAHGATEGEGGGPSKHPPTAAKATTAAAVATAATTRSRHGRNRPPPPSPAPPPPRDARGSTWVARGWCAAMQGALPRRPATGASCRAPGPSRTPLPQRRPRQG